ncbi:MAG: TlpA family protein disulfide reductase [Alphaproteobacteria bacterium]|nr:TlpA family protein disulfide reductase [Alphaproteobacteria bacterium]
MTEKDKENQASRKGMMVPFLIGAVIAAVAASMFMGGEPEKPQTATTSAASTSNGISKALVTGQMKNFVLKADLPALPEVPFRDGENKEMKLSDWKGRVVMLNLWATWCAPCRHEMPSINRLQEEFGSDQFEVVALSVDRKGLEASAKFLKETKASALKLYVDKTSDALQTLGVIGLPATFLIDREGREIGRLLGPAEWDSDEAKALIKAALGSG